MHTASLQVGDSSLTRRWRANFCRFGKHRRTGMPWIDLMTFPMDVIDLAPDVTPDRRAIVFRLPGQLGDVECLITGVWAAVERKTGLSIFMSRCQSNHVRAAARLRPPHPASRTNIAPAC